VIVPVSSESIKYSHCTYRTCARGVRRDTAVPCPYFFEGKFLGSSRSRSLGEVRITRSRLGLISAS